MGSRGTRLLLIVVLATLPLGGCLPGSTAIGDEQALRGPTVRPLRHGSVTPSPTPTRTPEPTPEPEPEELITPLAYGVFHDGAYAAAYVVVHNPSASRRLERIRAAMIVYDTTGAALTRAQTSWLHLMPNERQAFTTRLTGIPNDRRPGKIEFAFGIGRIHEQDTTAPLSTENIRLLRDRSRFQVSGDVFNPYTEQINDALVTAVAYDADGNVIGGGSTRISFVPAKGKAAALVDIRTPSAPARVELFAALTSAS